MARSRAGSRLPEAGYIVAAFLITFGFWFGPDVYDRLQRELQNPPAPVASPLPDVSDTGDAPAPIRAPVPPTAPSGGERERQRNVQALQRMAQTCAFWSRRDEDPSGRVFRDRACKEMRRFAARTDQAVPRINVQPSTPSTRAFPEIRRPSVHVNECARHERGTIRYRQCRANEKQRLKQLCQYFRQREQWSQAGAWCAAADRYRIVE